MLAVLPQGDSQIDLRLPQLWCWGHDCPLSALFWAVCCRLGTDARPGGPSGRDRAGRRLSVSFHFTAVVVLGALSLSSECFGLSDLM